MKIVVTNDDGYDAAGLAALTAVAEQFGQVTVVAPATPQSYMGHRVTTQAPIEVKQTGEREYQVSGTTGGLRPHRPALPGTGRRLAAFRDQPRRQPGGGRLHFGTVAAAREAALLGIRRWLSPTIGRGGASWTGWPHSGV